jgi:transposase
MELPVVGVDVAKATFDIALPLDAPDKFRTRAKIPNGPAGFAQIEKWLEQHAPNATVCMEATGIYHEALATFLFEKGHVVHVINPARVAAQAKAEGLRVKTDHSDAKLIARFGVAHRASLRPWKPPTPIQQKLRALFNRLQDLDGMEQMETNRRSTADPSVIASIDEMLDALAAQIAQVKKEINDHIDSDPTLKEDRRLLETIPGIGEKLSATLLACIGDLRSFNDPNKLDAFVGLNPSLRESGNWKGANAISRMGNPIVRAKLYMCAMVAKRHNPLIRTFVERLRARGKPHMVALVAAMRKLLHIAWGVVRSGKDFDPNFGVA